MKLTEILYEDVKEIWDGYLKHPFVSGIGDGSLSLERFRFYMLQDYLYLYDYARVYALVSSSPVNRDDAVLLTACKRHIKR